MTTSDDKGDINSAANNDVAAATDPSSPPLPQKVRGRPFKPGQSGNPNGRPKIPEELRTTAKQLCPYVLKRMAEIIKDGENRDAIAAGHLIFDRAYGKPAQDIGITVEQELTQALIKLEKSLPSNVYMLVLSALADERQTSYERDGATDGDIGHDSEPGT